MKWSDEYIYIFIIPDMKWSDEYIYIYIYIFQEDFF